MQPRSIVEQARILEAQQKARSIEEQMNKLKQEQAAYGNKNWLSQIGDLAVGIGRGIVEPVYNTLRDVGVAGASFVGQGIDEQKRKQLQTLSDTARNDWAKKYGFGSYQEAMQSPDKVTDEQWDELSKTNKYYADKFNERSKEISESAINKRLQEIDPKDFAADAGQTLLTASSFLLPMAAPLAGAGKVAQAANAATKVLQGGGAKSLLGKVAGGAVRSGIEGAGYGALEAVKRDEDVLEGALSSAGSAAVLGGIMGGVGGIKQRRAALKEPLTEATSQTGAALSAADDAILSPTNVPKGTLSSVREGTGEKLLSAQANVPKPAARNLKIKPAKTITKVAKKTGLTNLTEMGAMADDITGYNSGKLGYMDEIQQHYTPQLKPGDDLLLKSRALDIMTINPKTRLSSSALGSEKESFVKNVIEDISNGDPLVTAKRMKQQSVELSARPGMANPAADIEKARVYGEIADSLFAYADDQVPQQNIKTMFSEALDQTTARAQEAARLGNRQMADAWTRFAQEIDKAPRTIRAYSSLKKDFVDISHINQLTELAKGGAGQNFASSIRGIPNRVVDTVLGEPAEQVMAKAGGALVGAGTPTNMATALGASATTTPTTVGDTANLWRRIVGFKPQGGYTTGPRLAAALGAGSAVTTADDRERAAESARLGGQIGKLQGQLSAVNLMGQQTPQPSFGGIPLADLEYAATAALTAGDFKSYQQIAALYDMASSRASSSDLNTTQMNRLASLESSGTALDKLSQLLTQAGGGQGVIKGNIRSMLGSLGLDPDVSTYNQIAQGLVNQIVAAVGKTDALNTEAEVQRALDLVPRVTDDQQTAMNKLAALQDILGTNRATLLSQYGQTQ